MPLMYAGGQKTLLSVAELIYSAPRAAWRILVAGWRLLNIPVLLAQLKKYHVYHFFLKPLAVSDSSDLCPWRLRSILFTWRQTAAVSSEWMDRRYEADWSLHFFFTGTLPVSARTFEDVVHEHGRELQLHAAEKEQEQEKRQVHPRAGFKQNGCFCHFSCYSFVSTSYWLASRNAAEAQLHLCHSCRANAGKTMRSSSPIVLRSIDR